MGMDKARNTSRLWVYRLLAGAVGLILLTAGLLKATDIELFIEQIGDYGIISQGIVLTLSAWGLIALECVLGVGLLIFYRPRLILSLTALLLLIFLGATTWAWLTDVTEDCGCFSAWLRRTPGEAVLGNLILLAAIALAWLGHRTIQVPQSRGKTWAIATACLIGLTLPVVFGFRTTGIRLPESKAVEVEIGYLRIQGLEHIDLNQGVYLIVLMDTECLHCQEVVSELNELAQETDLPHIIALCTNEESQRIMFVEKFELIFPIGKIEEDVFWRLLTEGDIPRIILVRDGHVQQIWDQKIPDKDRIKMLLSQSPRAHLSIITNGPAYMAYSTRKGLITCLSHLVTSL